MTVVKDWLKSLKSQEFGTIRNINFKSFIGKRTFLKVMCIIFCIRTSMAKYNSIDIQTKGTEFISYRYRGNWEITLDYISEHCVISSYGRGINQAHSANCFCRSFSDEEKENILGILYTHIHNWLLQPFCLNFSHHSFCSWVMGFTMEFTV